MEQSDLNGAAGTRSSSGKGYTLSFNDDNSRPNLEQSSTTSSSEISSHSPHIDEMSSQDIRLKNARILDNARRYSLDEMASRKGASIPGSIGPHQGSSLIRHKSSVPEYGGGQGDVLRRMCFDAHGKIFIDKNHQLPTSTYDNYKQPSPLAPSPLHSAQHGTNNSSPSSRSMQQQCQYPPLPPPGALRRVQCRHCAVLLAIPEKLPSNQKNIQKLRCGSCRKISIFSTSHAEDGCNSGSNHAVVVSSTSRSNSMNNPSLLPSSPENQAEFASAYKAVIDSLNAGERQRSGRRYSVSDLTQKQQIQEVLARKHSLGNADLAAVQEEMMERSLSGRSETMTVDSNYAATTSRHHAFSSSSESVDTAVTESYAPSPDVLSSDPLPTFPSNHFAPYQTVGSPQTFGNIAQTLNIRAGEKRYSEIGFSDSDSETIVRTHSATNSQLSNSGSLTPRSTCSSPLQDPRSTSAGRAHEDASNGQKHEDGVLNKTLNRIFLFRKSKHGGTNQYRRKVIVNGVPIADHLVKKAEEQAGRIHPGTYWYDMLAGFWGVAGGQCLGIIPPFIEEFNYPMTRDCAGGRTTIFVNGRELHYMDRDKLCRRGLPDTPGMSYRIEIDGRVIEESTGSELRGLRRLAPSLEKSGRGTGMHVPPSNISAGRS